MFCKYCGKKIEKSEQPCPHCGKEQGMLCSTDGYFGILENVKLDCSKERVIKEVHINDGTEEKKEAIKIEEMKKESEPEKLLEGSDGSRIIDGIMNWEICKKFVNRKRLSIIAIVVLLVLFIACNSYQNYNIETLQKRVSDLEEQITVYQESMRNVDEEKVNSQNE